MADLAKLVEELSALTVMEAADLSKMLEEKWGVSAAAAVAAPAAGGAAAAGARRAGRRGRRLRRTVCGGRLRAGHRRPRHAGGRRGRLSGRGRRSQRHGRRRADAYPRRHGAAVRGCVRHRACKPARACLRSGRGACGGAVR